MTPKPAQRAIVSPHHTIDGIVEAIDAARLAIEDYLVHRQELVDAQRMTYREKIGNPVDADRTARQRLLGVVFNNLLDFSHERDELRAHLVGPARASTEEIIDAESDLQDLITPEPPPPEGGALRK